MLEAEFWVFLAFVAFLGVLGYFGMHNKFVTRHTRMAQDKIAQAEAQALADVRSAAADAAVAAASSVLAATVKDGIADNLLAQGVADLKTKLR